MKIKKGYIISGSNPDTYIIVIKIRPLLGVYIKDTFSKFSREFLNHPIELNRIFPWNIITDIFRIKE